DRPDRPRERPRLPGRRRPQAPGGAGPPRPPGLQRPRPRRRGIRADGDGGAVTLLLSRGDRAPGLRPPTRSHLIAMTTPTARTAEDAVAAPDDPAPAVPRPEVSALHVYAGNLYGGIETMLATLARHRHLAP